MVLSPVNTLYIGRFKMVLSPVNTLYIYIYMYQFVLELLQHLQKSSINCCNSKSIGVRLDAPRGTEHMFEKILLLQKNENRKQNSFTLMKSTRNIEQIILSDKALHLTR